MRTSFPPFFLYLLSAMATSRVLECACLGDVCRGTDEPTHGTLSASAGTWVGRKSNKRGAGGSDSTNRRPDVWRACDPQCPAEASVTSPSGLPDISSLPAQRPIRINLVFTTCCFILNRNQTDFVIFQITKTHLCFWMPQSNCLLCVSYLFFMIIVCFVVFFYIQDPGGAASHDYSSPKL